MINKELSKKEKKEHSSIGDMKLFDSHCHITDHAEELSNLKDLKISKIALMGTKPQDWDVIAQTHQTHPEKVVFGFGIHPWFAHKFTDSEDWFNLLRQKAKEHPISFIGEIGIDKAVCSPHISLISHSPLFHVKAKAPETGKNEFEAQKKVFMKQIELACELGKPVSLHCVRSAGILFEMFREMLKKGKHNIPKKIMLHSYGGSAEFVTQFCKMKEIGDRFFFSFSKVVNMRSPKLKDILLKVPSERLLIESDLDSIQFQEESLLEICEFVAEARGWTLRETAEITFSNSLSFFGTESNK